MHLLKNTLTSVGKLVGNHDASRVVLRSMQAPPYLFALAMATTGLMATRANAQADTASIGGAVENEAYLGEGPGADLDVLPETWSEEDSMANIPAYLVYRDWDTDDIFKRTDLKDTISLQLSHSGHDHYMPICGRITSPFGPRHGNNHYGTDLKLETGDPVYCAFPGMVRISRYHRDFGNVVVVRHTNGLETLYGHMSARKVEVGDVVQAGTELGLGGSTGRSTGSHLHFETRYRGVPIDPAKVFDLEAGTLLSDDLLLTPAINRKPVATAGTRKTWKVRSGDTLSGISRRTGTSVATLQRLNGLGKRSVLHPGQRIRYK
jgi:murein DD-endopeptidase MepM/ murein hydrolase activator NlpD